MTASKARPSLEFVYRILSAALAPAVLFFNGASYVYAGLGFLAILAVSGARGRWVALWISSLTLAFFVPHIFGSSGVPILERSEAGLLTGLVASESWLFPVARGILPLLFSYLCFELARWSSRQARGVREIIQFALPLAAVALIWFSKVLGAWPWLATLTLLFALSLAFYVWFIVLSLDSPTALPIYRARRNFWIFSLFFWNGPLPYFHVESTEALLQPPKFEVSYGPVFWKLLEVAVLSCVFWVIRWYLFTVLGLPNLWATGTSAFIAQCPSVLWAWALVAVISVSFLIAVYSTNVFAALTLYFFGVKPVYNMDRPWAAKSFHEFIGRSLYFYNFPLTTAYWPVYLRFIKRLRLPDRLKISILVFFSALHFSFVFHLLRVYQLFIFNPVGKGLAQYFGAISPYVILFSLAIALSVLKPEIWRWGNNRLWVRAGKIAGFVLLYSFLFSLVINFPIETFASRLELTRFLLLGAR